MSNDIEKRLGELRASFAEVQGSPFQHFFCPILFRDEQTQLCRAHLVNQAFADSSRKWTVQRADVDNFFGSIAESDFVDIQHNEEGLAEKAMMDRKLHRRFKPQILVGERLVEYYEADGRPIPSGFTAAEFDIDGTKRTFVLKLSAAEVKALPDDWELNVAKDVVVQSVISVLKAAHLAMFSICGYRHAFSEAGIMIGSALGTFFDDCKGLGKPEALKRARSHFKEVARLVRPVINREAPLAGTAEDGYARFCWLENAPEIGWAIIVFVRTGRHLHAVLMPLFQNDESVERFQQFLTGENDQITTNIVQFRDDEWNGHPQREVQHWPKTEW